MVDKEFCFSLATPPSSVAFTLVEKDQSCNRYFNRPPPESMRAWQMLVINNISFNIFLSRIWTEARGVFKAGHFGNLREP